MHFISSGGMAFVIGLLAKKSDNKWPAMIAGVATRVGLMIPLNMLITPIYTGAPLSVIMKMIVPAIIPFNIIHGGLNTVLSSLVLKALPASVIAQIKGRA